MARVSTSALTSLLGFQVQSPFLKWAGNKFRVLPHLWPLIPSTSGRFIEPFVGSGCVALNVQADKTKRFSSCIVSDFNPDLIGLFNSVKNNPKGFIHRTQMLFNGTGSIPHGNSLSQYNHLRDVFNGKTTDLVLSSLGIGKPELFVYLNRHCFNGLCRYNGSGQFNVPFGSYSKHPLLPDTQIDAFSALVQNVQFSCGDYRAFLAQCNPGTGDVVYLDPPYVPLSATASFTSYSKSSFGLTEQTRLASLAEHYSQNGAIVIVSNHDTPLTRQLYRNAASIHSFGVQRSVGATKASRAKAPELIAIFR